MKTLAECLLEALTAAYPEDRLSPGVVCSYLGDKHVFYCSIARYPHGEKQIVAKATADTLGDAIDIVASEWFAKFAPAESAIRSLRLALKARAQ